MKNIGENKLHINKLKSDTYKLPLTPTVFFF